MLRAMRVHYKKKMFLESLSPGRAHERLSSGWALVAGVTYRRIPMPWRRHARHFMKGHRITLIGWNGRETWILDPMATKGTNWTGERIPWSVIERAWWPGEQLWFAEGMFRTPPRIKVRDKVPNGRWTLPKGSRLVLRSGRNPRVIVRKFIVAETKSGHFNQIVEPFLKDGTSMGEFIRISSGNLAGMLIPSEHEQPDAQSQAGFVRWPKKQKAAPKSDSKKAGAEPEQPRLPRRPAEVNTTRSRNTSGRPSPSHPDPSDRGCPGDEMSHLLIPGPATATSATMWAAAIDEADDPAKLEIVAASGERQVLGELGSRPGGREAARADPPGRVHGPR